MLFHIVIAAIAFLKYSPDVPNFQRLIFGASCLHAALKDQLYLLQLTLGLLRNTKLSQTEN